MEGSLILIVLEGIIICVCVVIMAVYLKELLISSRTIHIRLQELQEMIYEGSDHKAVTSDVIRERLEDAERRNPSYESLKKRHDSWKE